MKASHQHWMRDKKFNLLMQFSLAKHADLPDVPLVMDLATHRRGAADPAADLRPAGDGASLCRRRPGVPKDRADALRKAFMATMADKEFLAEVDKAQFEITAGVGREARRHGARHLSKTPPAVAEKAMAMVK